MQHLLLLLVNSLYLLSWLAIYKFRCSKKDNVRIFDNDYEFYTSLPMAYKEIYWQNDTKLINQFFFHFFIIMNIAFIVYVFSDLILLTLIIILLGFLTTFIIYTRSYLRMKKEMKVKNDIK